MGLSSQHKELKRIVLDTNVVASVLLFGGNPRTILTKVFHSEYRAITSPPLLAELLEVLRLKRASRALKEYHHIRIEAPQEFLEPLQ